MTLNLQDIATGDHGLVRTVRTIAPSVAQIIAVYDIPIITAPLSQHSVILHSTRIVVIIPGIILATESTDRLSLVHYCGDSLVVGWGSREVVVIVIIIITVMMIMIVISSAMPSPY